MQYEIEAIISLHGHVAADGQITKTHAFIKWRDFDDSWNDMIPLEALVDDAPAALSEHIASLSSAPRLSQSVQSRLDAFRRRSPSSSP